MRSAGGCSLGGGASGWAFTAVTPQAGKGSICRRDAGGARCVRRQARRCEALGGRYGGCQLGLAGFKHPPTEGGGVCPTCLGVAGAKFD